MCLAGVQACIRRRQPQRVVRQMKINDKSQTFSKKTFVLYWKDYIKLQRVERKQKLKKMSTFGNAVQVAFMSRESLAWSKFGHDLQLNASQTEDEPARLFPSSAHHYQRSLHVNAANNSV